MSLRNHAAETPEWNRTARAAIRNAVIGGAEAYRRARHLARLIPIEPSRLANHSPENDRWIVARLARALRAERNRGRAGHWTYDLNRHIGLWQAYAAERQALARADRPPGGMKKPPRESRRRLKPG